MATLGYVLAALALVGAGLGLSAPPARAHLSTPESDLASARARVTGANGTPSPAGAPLRVKIERLLWREGAGLPGAATGSRNSPLTIEFVKDSGP